VINFKEVKDKNGEKRIRPTPPNLRRTPARIIDPAVGAST